MNPELSAPQRSFVNDVKRIDDMERRLRFFQNQVFNFIPFIFHFFFVFGPCSNLLPRSENFVKKLENQRTSWEDFPPP